MSTVIHPPLRIRIHSHDSPCPPHRLETTKVFSHHIHIISSFIDLFLIRQIKFQIIVTTLCLLVLVTRTNFNLIAPLYDHR